jgi:hypothetical protein
VPVAFNPYLQYVNVATVSEATVSILSVESKKKFYRTDNIFSRNEQILTRYLLCVTEDDNGNWTVALQVSNQSNFITKLWDFTSQPTSVHKK